MASPEKIAPRVLVRAGERGPAFTAGHPYNPKAEVRGWGLSREAGLGRIAVNLGRVPPGRESAVFHVHAREEEWAYVLEGRGVVELGDGERELGPGDFLGFPPGVAHQVRNASGDDLVLLVGGEILPDVDVAEFPRLGRLLVRRGARTSVYPLDAEVPFLPPEAQAFMARLLGAAPQAAPARVLVAAAERGAARQMAHEENPRSEAWVTPLSRRAGLARIAVSHVRVPAGRESWVFHVHHGHEEWMWVLAGQGVAEVGEGEHAIGPGDFLGFPPGGPGHHVRNASGEDLVYLAGGDALRGVEVVDFPRLGKRKVFLDARRWATYPLGA